MRRTFFPAVLLLAFLLLQTGTAFAQKTFYWEAFDVDIVLNEDGTLDITERQTLVFRGETFSFGYRNIPNRRLDNITNLAVREGGRTYTESSSNAPNTFEVTRSRDEVRIDWYFPPTVGVHTYIFGYTVEGAVRVEDDGSQIFWMAIPPDLVSRVESSIVTITVPEGVTIGSTTGLLDGVERGATVRGISEDQRTATFQANNLFSGDTFEVGVRFPSDQLVLQQPEWQRQEPINDAIALTVLVASLGILVGAPLLVLMLWYTRGRDPEAAFSAEYIIDPPNNLPPGVVGSLVDEKAQLRDVLATLVDLARRGYLTIKEEKNDHVYDRTVKPTTDLRPYEKKLMRAVFHNRQTRKLSSLRYKFSEKLDGIYSAMYEDLVQSHYFRRSPQSVRTQYRAAGWGAVIVAVVAFVGLGSVLSQIETAACPGIALIPGALALLWVATHMPRKTQEGAEEAAKWDAFKKYLKEVESYEYMTESAEIFEKYLPYAIAFGFERSWIRKFSRIDTATVPPWYIPYPRHGRHGRRYGRGPVIIGGGGFPGSSGRGSGEGMGGGVPNLEDMSGGMTRSLEGMSDSLTRMLNSTSTIMQTVKPPSNSSGSFGGGGGFSGGFGGGSSGGGGGGFG